MSDPKVVPTKLGRLGMLECRSTGYADDLRYMLARTGNVHIAAWLYNAAEGAPVQFCGERRPVYGQDARAYRRYHALLPLVGHAEVFNPLKLSIANTDGYSIVEMIDATIDPAMFINEARDPTVCCLGVLKRIEETIPACASAHRAPDSRHGPACQPVRTPEKQ
jgi:hypothetical protein